MANLAKVAQKIFGSSPGVDQVSVFGSLAAGSETFSTDPTAIQSLSNWLTGFYAAVIGGNAPTIQDMNGFNFVVTRQLAYLMQKGVAEWDAVTQYYTGSMVNVAGVLYVSLQDNNIDNATTDPAWWKAQSSDPVGTGKDYWGASLPSGYVWASGKTIGNASSNATERANADTLDLFTLFWNAYSDSVLPIYTSAGIASTRGASATIDWAANKAISVIDKRGRVSAGKDDLGGTAANRLTTAILGSDPTILGDAGGAQTQTLLTAQMPIHTHVQNSHTHTQNSHSHTAVGEPAARQAGPNIGWGIAAGSTSGTAGTGVATPIINSTTATNQDTGGDGAHENIQPTIVCNYIIKL